MNDNKQLKDEERKTDEEYTGKTYAYIGLGLMAGAALFFGLSFTVIGIYSLIASILLSLASITFINLQKKKQTQLQPQNIYQTFLKEGLKFVVIQKQYAIGFYQI